MKAYIAQVTPLGWVGLMVPALVVVRLAATAVAHSAVPVAVCNFLRLL